jgi:hypothetical protein
MKAHNLKAPSLKKVLLCFAITGAFFFAIPCSITNNTQSDEHKSFDNETELYRKSSSHFPVADSGMGVLSRSVSAIMIGLPFNK